MSESSIFPNDKESDRVGSFVSINTLNALHTSLGNSRITGNSTRFEAPSVVDKPQSNSVYTIDFSTEAKFMCHPSTFVLKNTNRKAIVIKQRNSITDLEYKRPCTNFKPILLGKVNNTTLQGVQGKIPTRSDLSLSKREKKSSVAEEVEHSGEDDNV